MAFSHTLEVLKSYGGGGEGVPDSLPFFLPYLFSFIADLHMQHTKN